MLGSPSTSNKSFGTYISMRCPRSLQTRNVLTSCIGIIRIRSNCRCITSIDIWCSWVWPWSGRVGRNLDRGPLGGKLAIGWVIWRRRRIVSGTFENVWKVGHNLWVVHNVHAEKVEKRNKWTGRKWSSIVLWLRRPATIGFMVTLGGITSAWLSSQFSFTPRANNRYRRRTFSLN